MPSSSGCGRCTFYTAIAANQPTGAGGKANLGSAQTMLEQDKAVPPTAMPSKIQALPKRSWIVRRRLDKG